MTFTEEELQQIEQMASLYMSISDIATILGVWPEELRRQIKIKGNLVSIAYNKGKTMPD